ncbi:hypothetical protein RhiirB3_492722 [Rhizophagus irregularis]|nr:hypothetical protein RhiirB3_492722 [Rhizophagus irregularis]
MAIYSCPHCERVFSRRASLRNHVKTHDDIIDKVLREIAEEVEHEQEEVGDDERLEEASYEEGEEERGSTNNDEVQEEVSYEEESEDNDEVLEDVNYKGEGEDEGEEEEEGSDNDEQLEEVSYEEEEEEEEEELLSNKDIFAHCTFTLYRRGRDSLGFREKVALLEAVFEWHLPEKLFWPDIMQRFKELTDSDRTEAACRQQWKNIGIDNAYNRIILEKERLLEWLAKK